jgi:BirA family biotin operon repressor/biotin-[acetyl-CoA-carboxylase] ligase
MPLELPGTLPPLPSVFTPHALPASADAPAAAMALAAGQGAGTLVWAEAADRIDAAVVLEPETVLEAARPALLAAANAMADALVVLGPPEIPVTLRWPAILLVNGGEVGQAVLAVPPGAAAEAVPDWIVVGVRLRMRQADGAEPGLHPGRTVLFEEGFGDILVPELVAAWARHLMAGLSEWQSDSIRRLAEKTLARLEPEDWMRGARRSLDPRTGALWLDRDGQRSRYELEATRP